MASLYFMGIDNGGSSTKCVIYDTSGRTIAHASTHIPMLHGQNGQTERHASNIWLENCRIIRETLELSGLQGSDIACVGLCGYGGGLGMLDKHQNPLAPFIVSTDSRAEALLSEFRSDGVEDRVYERTLQKLWAGQPAVLLPWFKRFELDTYASCSHVVTIKDYIRFRLTGVLATEATDASNTNLFSIHTGAFDRTLFEALGIEESFSCFPDRLIRPYDIAGYVTEQAALECGLPAGVPIAAGLYDVAACCLGSGILDERTLCLIIGTWSISGHLTSTLENRIGDSSVLHSFVDSYYFVEESSPTSASNLDWFVEQFYSKMLTPENGNVYAQCDHLVADISPSDSSLIFLPYLYGSNTVTGAKACFFNMESHHTSSHILLAIYEGILFSLLDHINSLLGGQNPYAARLSGGASRSAVWCQMLCDMLGTTLDVMESDELGALGSAICAAVAIGAFPELAVASAAMSRVRHAYYPNPARTELYRSKYRNYCRAVKAINGFYND